MIHCDEQTQGVFDFGEKANKSAYLSHFVAHYADLENEILEVKSGYRLALIYSLCWENSNELNFNRKNRHEYRSLVYQMSSCLNTLNDNDNLYLSSV